MVRAPVVPPPVQRNPPDLLQVHAFHQTGKAWILPDGLYAPVDTMHFLWLRRNRAWLAAEYSLRLPTSTARLNNEQPARVWAIRRGFARVNASWRTHHLTVEVGEPFWTRTCQRRIARLLDANATLSTASVNVLRLRDMAPLKTLALRGILQTFTPGPRGSHHQQRGTPARPY